MKDFTALQHILKVHQFFHWEEGRFQKKKPFPKMTLVKHFIFFFVCVQKMVEYNKKNENNYSMKHLNTQSIATKFGWFPEKWYLRAQFKEQTLEKNFKARRISQNYTSNAVFKNKQTLVFTKCLIHQYPLHLLPEFDFVQVFYWPYARDYRSSSQMTVPIPVKFFTN